MNFIISTATDIGTTKATNQDSFNARVMTTPLGRMAFAVVCDGMGGLDKGEVASASVVNAFCKWAEQRLPDLCESGLTDSAVRADWVGIATEYNEKIKLYGKRCGLASGLGTTVTAMLLTEQRYYIINVGDTRAYEIGDHVVLLTKDQTVVAREVELGNLTQVEAETDPRRSVLLQYGAECHLYAVQRRIPPRDHGGGDICLSEPDGDDRCRWDAAQYGGADRAEQAAPGA